MIKPKHLLVGLLLIGRGLPAAAEPTMIRLGYPGCGACHVSSQGGGPLTDYGKGIDLAQSLLAREYEPSTVAGNRRFSQDVRMLVATHRTTDLTRRGGAVGSMDARFWHRAVQRLTARQRLSSIVAINTQPFRASTTSPASRVFVTKVQWEHRLKESLQVSVGRDLLASHAYSADHQVLLRATTEPGATPFPVQAKLFWSTKRIQLTPYVFGPWGSDNRDRGGGVMSGVVAFNQRAVFGLSGHASRSSVNDLASLGAYTRLGFGHWGIQAEQQFIERSPRIRGLDARRGRAGHVQVFVAPREWLVASLSASYMPLEEPGTGYLYRLSPSARLRVSNKVTLVIGEGERLGEPAGIRSRSFSVQLFLKTVD